MRLHVPLLLAALAVTVSACAADVGDDEDTAASEDALKGALDNGAGAGPEHWHVDPCEHPQAYARKHGYNFIQAKPNERTDGTEGKDLIVGTDGDDRIYARGGEDIVCAGYGEDHVWGGDGRDYIDGGGDNDHLWGEGDDDVLHGRGGGDYVYGGPGDDMVFGDILDDHLFGDDGNDLIVGGHGTDVMRGGDGNDYLRGDTGNDVFDGGKGHDVASFATAMPPGQGVEGHATKWNGVKVDFTNACGGHHDGCANGDGGNEPLDGIEVVVGSPYDDVFVNDGGAKVRFIGGYGDDTCDGAPCGTPLPAGAAGKVFVYLDRHARDTGVALVGTNGSDHVEIVRQKGDDLKFVPRAGTDLFAGPGCHMEGGAVSCNSKHVMRWVAAWMAGGDDVVKLELAADAPSERFPVDFTAHVNGGEGDDWLHGSSGQDVLFTGQRGRDHLYGNAGDDALLSESRKWPGKDCSALSKEDRAKNPRCDEDKPNGDAYEDGADDLFAGAGDDQLVADYPCGNHHYSGGGGRDVAGFARSGRFGIHAQLGGDASKPQPFHGRAFNPQLCGKDNGTRLEDDLEILEASDGDDELWGNDKDNVIWGREGDDRIHGLGGDDVLDGLVGDDWLFGGEGKDLLRGAGGKDHVFQDAD